MLREAFALTFRHAAVSATASAWEDNTSFEAQVRDPHSTDRDAAQQQETLRGSLTAEEQTILELLSGSTRIYAADILAIRTFIQENIRLEAAASSSAETPTVPKLDRTVTSVSSVTCRNLSGFLPENVQLVLETQSTDLEAVIAEVEAQISKSAEACRRRCTLRPDLLTSLDTDVGYYTATLHQISSLYSGASAALLETFDTAELAYANFQEELKQQTDRLIRMLVLAFESKVAVQRFDGFNDSPEKAALSQAASLSRQVFEQQLEAVVRLAALFENFRFGPKVTRSSEVLEDSVETLEQIRHLSEKLMRVA